MEAKATTKSPTKGTFLEAEADAKLVSLHGLEHFVLWRDRMEY